MAEEGSMFLAQGWLEKGTLALWASKAPGRELASSAFGTERNGQPTPAKSARCFRKGPP